MPRLGKTQTMLLMKLPQTKPETRTLETRTLEGLAQAQQAVTQ